MTGDEPKASYLRPMANLGILFLGVLALGLMVASRRPEAKPAPRPAPTPVASVAVAAPGPAPEPEPEPAPDPGPKPLDQEAVAGAEAARDAARRDRTRAEARAAEASRRLSATTTEAALAQSRSRKLAFRVRDPSAQIAQASARGGFLRAERDKLQGELATLAHAPRPKAQSIVDKTPVAKPAEGAEFHFELRRNRVAFIDLDRLMTLVKADAQLRIRLSDSARLVNSKVGPVGAFSLQYVLGRALPRGLDELMERHGIAYDLRGWELVPIFEGRGETYEMARQPISDYARAINRLNAERSTITMWVYPDSFPLFRKLRDDLHARGFTVAARPLPEGMAIRGSPAGSLSAGQ